MKSISIIAALGPKGEIGFKGVLPWKVSGDLKKFRETTWGHGVVMGRKTFESLPSSLPERLKCVISSQKRPSGLPEEIFWCSSLEQAFQVIPSSKNIFVMGGGQVYASALHYASHLYLSFIPYEGPCDVFFPALNKNEWTIVSSETIPATQNDPLWNFQIWERK